MRDDDLTFVFILSSTYSNTVSFSFLELTVAQKSYNAVGTYSLYIAITVQKLIPLPLQMEWFRMENIIE